MKHIITVLTLSPLLLAATAFAQTGHEGHGHKPRAEAKQAPAAVKEAPAVRKIAAEEVGKEAVCPVTGEKFRIAEDTISMSYKGRAYYLCCAGCDKSFAKNPEKYLKKIAAAHKIYVCPMNDYQGDKPGKCPKCGMTLTEKKPAAKK